MQLIKVILLSIYLYIILIVKTVFEVVLHLLLMILQQE